MAQPSLQQLRANDSSKVIGSRGRPGAASSVYKRRIEGNDITALIKS